MLCLMPRSNNSAFATSLAKQTGSSLPPQTRTLRWPAPGAFCGHLAVPGPNRAGAADGGATTDHLHSGLSHLGDSDDGGCGAALFPPGPDPLPLPGLAQSASRPRQSERAGPSPVPHLRHGAAELPPPRPLWSHFRRLPAPDRKRPVKRETDGVPKRRGGAYGNLSARRTESRVRAPLALPERGGRVTSSMYTNI